MIDELIERVNRHQVAMDSLNGSKDAIQPLSDRIVSPGMTVRQKLILDMTTAQIPALLDRLPNLEVGSIVKLAISKAEALADEILSSPVFGVAE